MDKNVKTPSGVETPSGVNSHPNFLFLDSKPDRLGVCIYAYPSKNGQHTTSVLQMDTSRYQYASRHFIRGGKVKSLTTISLCTRLAHLSIEPWKSNRLSIKKKQFLLNFTKGILKNSEVKKLLLIDPNTWNRLQGIWSSYGSMVIGHPFINLNDNELLQSILSFKARFLKFYLNKCSLVRVFPQNKSSYHLSDMRYIFNEKGKKYLSEFDINLKLTKIIFNELFVQNPFLKEYIKHGYYRERLVWRKLRIPANSLKELEEYLKSLSVFFQRKAESDDYQHSDIDIPRIFSWYGSYPCLSIFGGSASYMKQILRPRYKVTEGDLLILTSLRSVGRSLPPSDHLRMISDCKDSLSIWLSHYKISESLQLRFLKALRPVLINMRAANLPKYSHLSLASSATFDYPRSKGGQTAESRFYFSYFLSYKFSIEGIYDTESIEPLYDAFSNKVTTIKSLVSLINTPYCPIGSCLYRDLTSEDNLRYFSRSFGLPEITCVSAGFKLLLACSGLLMNFGSYDIEPDILLVLTNMSEEPLKVPLWFNISGLHYKPRTIPVRLAASCTAGCKTRIVTCNKWCFGILGKYLHFIVEPVLRRNDTYASGQRLLWPNVHKFDKSRLSYYYSLDLKNATDYIPLDLIKLIWSTWSKFVYNSTLERFVETIYHPRTLHLRGKFKHLHRSPVLLKRGSLMGDPMSFMTLSIMQITIDRLIKSSWRCFDAPSLVLGDDYLTKLPSLNACKTSNLVFQSYGLTISKKNCISKRLGVFAESFIVVANNGKSCFVDSIKLRLLTTTPQNMMGDFKLSFIGKSKELQKLYGYTSNNTLKFVIENLFSYQFKKYYGHIRYGPLPFFLPTTLGGLGFPFKMGKFKEKYWHYFNHFDQDHKDDYERMIEVLRLQNLFRNPSKSLGEYGLRAIRILSRYLKHFKFMSQNVLSKFLEPKTIYSRNFIVERYKNLPFSDDKTLDGVSHFDSLLEKEKVFSISRLVSVLERIALFDKYLLEDIRPPDITISKWVRKAKRFWYPRVKNRPLGEPEPDFRLIESLFNKYVDYFVFLNDDSFLVDDISSSLRVNIFDPIGNKNHLIDPNGDYLGLTGKLISSTVLDVSDAEDDLDLQASDDDDF
jgi:hypothetical protein